MLCCLHLSQAGFICPQNRRLSYPIWSWLLAHDPDLPLSLGAQCALVVLFCELSALTP